VGEGGDVFLCTHAPHMWRLDHSQAQHEQAEAPPPVGAQSSRTAPRARRWNDASGTGGRETKAPSANCAHATTANESDRQRAAPQLSIRRQASSRIALTIVRAPNDARPRIGR